LENWKNVDHDGATLGGEQMDQHPSQHGTHCQCREHQSMVRNRPSAAEDDPVDVVTE
jgi:hypothetical protein